MQSIKHFRFFIFVLSAPIFLPLLLNPYHPIYTAAVFVLSLVSLLIADKESETFDSNLSMIKIINYLFIAIIILKMIVYKDYSDQIFKLIIPFILSLVVLRYSQSVPDQSSEEFIQKCFRAVYYIFVIQFILSVFESLLGSFLVADYNIANKNYFAESDIFINRFIIPVPLFLNPFNYLHFGLSGLLGQHNQWGMQLPVYNMIFLYAYLRKKEKIYLTIMMLVIIAQVLNTTRTSLVLIVLSDLFMFFYLYVKKSKKSKWLIYFAAVSGILIFSDKIIALLQAIVTKSDTLTVRLSIYQYAWYYLKAHFLELLIGYDNRIIGNLVIGFLRTAKYNAILRGFENGFFDMTFIYGIAGFFLFLCIVTTTLMILWKNVYGKLLSILFILYVIIINMTLSDIFLPYAFPFTTLLLIIISRDAVMQRNSIETSH